MWILVYSWSLASITKENILFRNQSYYHIHYLPSKTTTFVSKQVYQLIIFMMHNNEIPENRCTLITAGTIGDLVFTLHLRQLNQSIEISGAPSHYIFFNMTWKCDELIVCLKILYLLPHYHLTHCPIVIDWGL